jgi:hypothetical protein
MFLCRYFISISDEAALNNSQPILASIAHNVSAVYDVLPARIRACEARPGLAKCAGVSRGKEP